LNFLSKILHFIDKFSVIVGKTCKYIILAILGVLLYEIISRYFFHSPTVWASELSSYMFGAYFFLSGAYTLKKEEHVRMDILYSKLSKRKQILLDIITFPLLALYLGLFIYGGIGNIKFSIKAHEVSHSLWAPPLAPIKIIITFGAVLFLIEAIYILIKDIFMLLNKDL